MLSRKANWNKKGTMRHKRKNTIRNWMAVAFLVLAATGVSAQDKPPKQKSVEKQYKEFMNLQEQRSENRDAAMEKAREEHVDRQSKETKKRMKKNEKKMRRIKAGKHPQTFLQRLFTKKSGR